MTEYSQALPARSDTHVASLRIALAVLLSVLTLSAGAEYSYQNISPDYEAFVQVFGINDAGKVVGSKISEDGYGFVYDMKTGTYTELGDNFGPLDISNDGTMVGGLLSDTVCAVRDTKGNVTTLQPPLSDVACASRGVNSKGQVSGYAIAADGVWRGFIYDPASDSFEEFLPSRFTIAHAINAQGQNVGHVTLGPGAAYPGAPGGRYGYFRDAQGAVKYFTITQSWAGWTSARGISENGLVAGFFLDAPSFEAKSFVTTLSSGTETEQITLSDDEIVYTSPCNPNVPAPPGPGYDLYTDMTASQVRNDGVVVGSCIDYYYNNSTYDLIQYGSGFIATPID